MKFGELFGSLFRRSSSPAEATETRGDLEAELEAALRRLEQEQVERSQDTLVTPAERERLRLEEEHQRLRRQMEQDILSLHAALETGLEGGSLLRLESMLRAHAPPAEPGTLEEQIDAAVLARLFTEVGARAWERLGELMKRRSVEWPAVSGLEIGRTPERLEEARTMHLEEQRRAFLATGPLATADLMRGDVPVWRHYYPERDSYVWRETALKGVGGGLRAQLYAAALETWLWRPRDLDARIRELLKTYLEEAWSLLDAGLTSLTQAQAVSKRVERACDELIPEIVWSSIESQLEWDREGGPALAVLAGGLAPIDPVCQMALEPETAAARLEMGERTYYFCTTACRDRFQSDPKRYLEREP